MENKIKQQQKLVDLAFKQIGKPYKYGARVVLRPKKFDCSGLVQWLYNQIGIKLPRCSLEQAGCGFKIKKQLKLLQPGDLLFFTGEYGHYNPFYPQGIGHVVVYVGKNQIIHAQSRDGTGRVKLDSLRRFWRRRDLVVIKRILKN